MPKIMMEVPAQYAGVIPFLMGPNIELNIELLGCVYV